jgi:hypothetical protein
MKIKVEYKNSSGKIKNNQYNFTMPACIKHLAIAGQGYVLRPQKLFRTIGMLFHYSYYLQNSAFSNNHFSLPPPQLSDPTEKGQFSCLAGRAIADFLSKRIDHSLFTVNYEAYLRINNISIKGSRPDLIAYTKNSIFAIEAKGYDKFKYNMSQHKRQSANGRINVNFTIACVSYNLYSGVECKYYDPYNGNIEKNDNTFQELTKIYYSGLSEFLNTDFFKNEKKVIKGEEFFIIKLFDWNNISNFLKEFLHQSLCYLKVCGLSRLKLILPGEIREFAKNGITNKLEPFQFTTPEDENIYIDNDRVGLQID